MLQQKFSLEALATQPHGLLLGRLETCQIRFPPDARMIGREHAGLMMRPEGVFLVGLHQNGTFVDGAVVGQGGQIELHYGARIQLGKGGPILVLREQAELPPRAVSYGSQTVIEARPESDQDLRAQIEALKMANEELDRQNQELNRQNQELNRQNQELRTKKESTAPPSVPTSSSAPTPPSSAEAQATLQRFSQGLLQLQKSLSGEQPNLSELQGKLELLIFDLDDLHRVVTGR
jgi:predicted component of type VI protein secretion system